MQRIVQIAIALCLIAASTGAVLAQPAVAQAEKPPPLQCDSVMPDIASGAAAIDAIGDRLDEVADLNNIPEPELREMILEDEYLWVDPCGRIFYLDPAPEPIRQVPSSPPELLFPESQTFQLNSLPGSDRVIYLDFDGHVLEDTAWNAYFGLPSPYVLSPWNYEGSPSTWSTNELAIIQHVWQRVAEDFAPFNVNVTTQDPGFHAIHRSSLADNQYGTRAIITNDTYIQGLCNCGGHAYLGVFNNVGSDHSTFQPSINYGWLFGGSAQNIAEVVSHETGHNLGLDHHGQGSQVYYGGHGVWAPIMGVSYSKPVSQWSHGEYPGATRPGQDDVTIIQAHGAPYRNDDHANIRTSATPIGLGVTVPGIIHSRNDIDWFSFSASGQTTIVANPAPLGPNLDIILRLYTSSGTLLETANPEVTWVTHETAGGLGASITQSLSAGTYYVSVEGTGYGTAATGYTDYASIGQYTVQVNSGTGPDTQPPIITWTSPTSNEQVFVATGTTVPLEATVTDNVGVIEVIFVRWDHPLQEWFVIAYDTIPPYQATLNVGDLNPAWNEVGVVAVDAAGNVSYEYIWVDRPTGGDVTPPVVSWVAPVEDFQTFDVQSGTVSLQVTATDNVGVAYVIFDWWDPVLNQYVEVSVDYSAPYQATLHVADLRPGMNAVWAGAFDAAGNAEYKYIYINRLSSTDTEYPHVEWVLPVGTGEEYTVSGGSVLLQANATDNVGVTNFYFDRWDDNLLQWVIIGFDTTPPYQATLNVSDLAFGVNLVDANAFDAAGNWTFRRIYVNRVAGDSTMHVGNLRVYLRPTPSTTRVFTRIDVASSVGALSGAVVSIRVTNPNGTSSTYAATTNADGYVMLAHTANATGTYVAEVLSISRAGYTYAPELNYLTTRGLRVR